MQLHLRQPSLSGHDLLFLAGGAVIATAGFLLADLIHHMQVPLKPETANITSPWIPATVKKWQTPIDFMAKKYNVDPTLIAIIMTMESGGYSKATSEDNAQGLMQITPLTAGDIASKYLKTPTKKYDLMNPNTSIEFGAAYLAWLRNTFGNLSQAPSWSGTVELVSAGYNGGPGAAFNLEHGRGLTDTQTVIYSRDAYNMWRERGAKDSPTYDRWLERGGSILVNKAKAEKT
jgi:soluble lytic murein transglycosylase-like protein